MSQVLRSTSTDDWTIEGLLALLLLAEETEWNSTSFHWPASLRNSSVVGAEMRLVATERVSSRSVDRSACGVSSPTVLDGYVVTGTSYGYTDNWPVPGRLAACRHRGRAGVVGDVRVFPCSV